MGWKLNQIFSQESLGWMLFKLCSYLDFSNPKTNFPCVRPSALHSDPCFPFVFNFHSDVLTGNNPNEDELSLNSRFKNPVIFKSTERKKNNNQKVQLDIVVAM